MVKTTAIKENRDFRRLYARGKSAASGCVALYMMPNRLKIKNRLGITVSVKIGKAVKRNRIKRLIREAYRAHEAEIKGGFDFVCVARHRALGASYWEVEKSLVSCARKLHAIREAEGQ